MTEAKYQGFDTYTKTDYHGNVKENFKVLGDLLSSRFDFDLSLRKLRVLDFGCATGALLGYLHRRFMNLKMTGIDVSEELIKIAREKVPTAEFMVGGVEQFSLLERQKFDVALCFGVLGIFDEDEARGALKHLVRSVRPGGSVFVFSQFNEFDVDVIVRHRLTHPDVKWNEWGRGWNIYSYQTVGNWLNDIDCRYRFIDFQMPFELPPQDNPVRTWTFELPSGAQQLTNGMKLLVDLKFLEISV